MCLVCRFPESQQRIGSFFLSLMPQMKSLYVAYCSNHPSAVDVLTQHRYIHVYTLHATCVIRFYMYMYTHQNCNNNCVLTLNYSKCSVFMYLSNAFALYAINTCCVIILSFKYFRFIYRLLYFRLSNTVRPNPKWLPWLLCMLTTQGWTQWCHKPYLVFCLPPFEILFTYHDGMFSSLQRLAQSPQSCLRFWSLHPEKCTKHIKCSESETKRGTICY